MTKENIMTTKHAVIRQIKGLTFAGQADSGHWTIIDGPGELGGSDGGPRPKELLMLALASCTGSDVASILRKKRVPYTGLEVHVTGELRKEHPQVFTGLHVEYVISGDRIDPAAVERAIDLSETTYCSVSAMLRPAVEITSSYRIVSSDEVVPEEMAQ
jgi:putative redox protein